MTKRADVVRLTHPDSKRTIEVHSDHLGAYRSQGWREKAPVRTRPKAAPKTVPDVTDEVTPEPPTAPVED